MESNKIPYPVFNRESMWKVPQDDSSTFWCKVPLIKGLNLVGSEAMSEYVLYFDGFPSLRVRSSQVSVSFKNDKETTLDAGEVFAEVEFWRNWESGSYRILVQNINLYFKNKEDANKCIKSYLIKENPVVLPENTRDNKAQSVNNDSGDFIFGVVLGSIFL